jgi:DNA-binding CsgD family transcriptional regulator
MNEEMPVGQQESELLDRLDRIEGLVQSLVDLATAGSSSDVGTASSAALRRSLARLSPRQHATLQMLFRGAKNIEISDRLGVTANTVAGNVSTLARHFGVRGRTQLAARAQLAVATLSPGEYLELSGGLPIDWDANFENEPMQELLAGHSGTNLGATAP